MSQYTSYCSICAKPTLFVTREAPHHAFCTTCHQKGASADSVIGAIYNYKDKPRHAQRPCVDWHKRRPDLVRFNKDRAQEMQQRHQYV